jgi:hypothetical protein
MFLDIYLFGSLDEKYLDMLITLVNYYVHNECYIDFQVRVIKKIK